MLKVIYIGLVRYKTVKVATLNSITQLFHTAGVPIQRPFKVTASLCLSLAPLHAVDNVYGQRKGAMCLLVCGNKIVSERSA